MIAIIEGKGEIPCLLKKKIKHSFVIKLSDAPNINHIIKTLKNKGIKRVVFAGKFEKSLVYETKEVLPKNDEEIIKKISERLKKEGIRVYNQKRWLSSYLAKKGELTKIKPSNIEWEDIREGLLIAKKLNKLGIGQTICIKNGIVLSLEGLEGTDETIKRAGKIRNNFVVVKYGKRGEEIPTIGKKTIEVMKRVGARVLAIRSNVVLVLPETIELAEKNKISIIGV